jgi:hypothetical protein
MANIKNFGMIGVGSDVQFGKGGVKLVSTNGTFAAKDAQGNAFVRFQIADGNSASDAVTYSQLQATANAVADSVANAVDGVQNELDLTQAGAGLDTDGSYIAPVGSFYLNNTTSLANAIFALDTQAFNEANARATADAEFANALADATANALSLQAEIDQIETSVGLGLDGTLTLAAGNYLANAVDIVNAIETLDGVLGNTATEAAAANATATAANAAVSAVVSDLANTNAEVASVNATVEALSTTVTAIADSLDALSDNVATNTADIATNAASIANTNADVANTNADVAALTANAVLKDGSVAFTGAMSMGNNVIHDVATPVLGTDAANRDFVMQTVGELGNAFNYVGSLPELFGTFPVSGDGLTANTAFDLGEFPPEGQNAGDYYKVTAEGFYKVGANTAVLFEPNDGLVFNAIGDIDKIDNQSSVVLGTPGEIDVTGSASTGFTVGIDDSYTLARQQEVSDSANVAATATAAVASDLANTNADVAAVVSDLANTNADVAAVAADLVSTNANVVTLTGVVSGNSANIALLQGDIANAAGDLAAETAARIQGDSDNANAIASTNANVTSLAGNVATISNNVDALILELNTVETGAGLETDGSYSANALSHYLANATSLKTADEALDTAIYDLAQSLTTLSQDEIKTEDNLNSVKVEADKIGFNLNVGGVKTEVGSILADANTNTTATLDLTTAGEVHLAAGGASTDVDLRLSGKGAGQVIIGETGTGFIQADAGYDLNVAGGDGAALNLMGTAVNISSGEGDAIMSFVGVANATASFVATNGTTDVTFAATGAGANIDIVLDPKGTGTINASSSRIVSVANAVSANDAVNKGQLDTAIATATVGVVKTVVLSIVEVDGTYDIGQIAGTVLQTRTLVTGGFGPGAAIVIGSTATPNELASAADIDESAAGIYVVETVKDYGSPTMLTVTVTGSAIAGTGAAKVIVEYLSA